MILSRGPGDGLVLPRHFCSGPQDVTARDLFSENYLMPPVRNARSQRRRAWCFTYNNPSWLLEGDDSTARDYLDRLFSDTGVRYVIAQMEVGDNGTNHLQGYIEFKSSWRFNRVKELLGATVHITPRDGTAAQASDYCAKEDSRVDGPWILGLISQEDQGTRTDLRTMAESLLEHRDVRAIAFEHPHMYMRYNRGMVQLLAATQKVRSRHEAPEVILLYGPAGCGKTRYAYDTWGADMYRKMSNNRWFDGYFGQRCVLYDDFDGRMSKTELNTTLNWTDRYELAVETKGGVIPYAPYIVVITTNLHPHTWYEWENREAQYPALARRFTQVMVATPRNLVLRPVTCDSFFHGWYPGCDEDTTYIDIIEPEEVVEEVIIVD